MALLLYAQQRVRAFLSEIERLFESDFPYWDSKAALEQLNALFQRKLERLEQFDEANDPSVVAQECRITLLDLYTYLPLLGFILRSTNVRNAFEAFGPFLRLAEDVLEPGVESGKRTTKLLLSSEWDYSPFMYHRIPDLPNFLFIGLPAPESSNPLLVPLAGHELGHALWFQSGSRQNFQQVVQEEIIAAIKASWEKYQEVFPNITITPDELDTNLFARETWRLASEWCLDQAEETFCDLLGLRIFGASYLHAFGYILSPGFGIRSEHYPAIQDRVRHLVAAADAFGIAPLPVFASLFENDSGPSLSEADEYRIELADQALEQLTPALISRVADLTSHAYVPISTPEEIERVLFRIKQVVPAENCKTIADILNAGWIASNDAGLWAEYPSLKQKRTQVLREMILKNLEIFEIERIQSE